MLIALTEMRCPLKGFLTGNPLSTVALYVQRFLVNLLQLRSTGLRAGRARRVGKVERAIFFQRIGDREAFRKEVQTREAERRSGRERWPRI